MKRLLSMILTICLFIGLVPARAELDPASTPVSFRIPFVLTSGVYLSSNYQSERESNRTIRISGTSYPYYWWSGWINVAGIKKLRLRTVLESGAGFGFKTGDQVTVTAVPEENKAQLVTYLVEVPEGAEYFAFSTVVEGQTGDFAQRLINGQYEDISLEGSYTGDFDEHPVEEATPEPVVEATPEPGNAADHVLPSYEISSDAAIRRIPFTMTSGTYISAKYQGIRTNDKTVTINKKTYPYYWWSDWINVRGIDALRLRTVFGGGAGYAFRKGDQITAYSGESLVLQTYVIEVPDDAEYFAFSTVLFSQPEELAMELVNGVYNEISLEAISTGAFVERHAENIIQASRLVDPPFEMLLPSGGVLCIGDSLTYGSRPSGNDGYSGDAKAYGEWLAELGSFSGPVEIAAKSGYSPSDWYDDIEYWSDSVYEPYGTFLIWLGTNNGPTTLPADSFDQEPKGTETYYYRAIIERILKVKPRARIILGSVFASKDDVATVNTCIRAIAEKYPDNVLGVTTFDDGSLFGPEEAKLHAGFEKNPHFNTGGYFYVATRWLSEIRRLIWENIDKF